MTREDIENNVGYWQEKANLEYIRQRQEHGVNDPYIITEINEAFDAGFDKGYQYALQHPAWIPVEERLPEVGEPVWFYTPIMDEPMKGAYQGNDTWWSVEYESKFIDCVTHWMEIVPPPRKEE